MFDRISARLSVVEGRWVLKGGTSLEFRLGGRARATKDLDLALRDGLCDGDSLREELIETLANDVDRDRFAFAVGRPVTLDADAAGRPGWRFSVDSTLAGKTFAQIRLDVVLRDEELAAVERILLPGVLAFADVPARTIESVDRRQHFAEKLHALTRDYGSRPNTRVKDLVDLILLIEYGLSPDGGLLRVVRHVFTVRPLTRSHPSSLIHRRLGKLTIRSSQRELHMPPRSFPSRSNRCANFGSRPGTAVSPSARADAISVTPALAWRGVRAS